ncbi:MAG TPA: sterol desaturase, partial [bacterium]|nr:sterol desaturase [bacterium]
NTPSAHRVHHAVNPRYLDRNYAGVFIVWDRLLGTYEPEVEAPVYGTVKPLASFNPLWANVHYWVEMWRMAAATKRPMDKLKVWVAPPEWRPADLGGTVAIPEVTPAAQKKYGVRFPRAVGAWVAANYVALLAGTTAFLWFAGRMDAPARIASTAVIVATVIACGALFEHRRWALPLEAARLLGIGALALAAVW